MAIDKGHRFGIDFDDAFTQGSSWWAKCRPTTSTSPVRTGRRIRPVRQWVDEVTGKRQWKVIVTDPAETRAKRASFEITLPVPTTSEALPGMRQIELEGLTAEPRVAGQGGGAGETPKAA